MKVSFSVNQYDSVGDKFADCVLLNCGDNTILRFADIADVQEFLVQVKACIHEIESGTPAEEADADEPVFCTDSGDFAVDVHLGMLRVRAIDGAIDIRPNGSNEIYASAGDYL